MKKYIKMIIILIIHIALVYVLSVMAGPTDTMGVVVINIALALLVGLIIGGIEKEKMKLIYPILFAILYVPSSFMFKGTNNMFYLVYYISMLYVGLLVGMGVYMLGIKVFRLKDTHNITGQK